MAMIRCGGCEAIHDSRVPVCPGCGRCPHCGAKRASREDWKAWAECAACRLPYCASCGRCHGCSGLRFEDLGTCPGCGFPDDPETVASVERAWGIRPRDGHVP
jgi:hypothetical protein